jgi:hypothetical protein
VVWLNALPKAKWVRQDANDKGGVNSIKDWDERFLDDTGIRPR